ncbi:Uncharacterized protein Fot_46430 [Forsythia ovata]|uniref:Uncharacterized protein n=1 Tax=Forsythia ovata TaxID=205694 RepID=A0ABD1QQT6_9LAMI
MVGSAQTSSAIEGRIDACCQWEYGMLVDALFRISLFLFLEYGVLVDALFGISLFLFLGKVPKAKLPHLYQRPLDQTDCKSRNVHEWQRPKGESQQANSQDTPTIFQ